MAPGRAGARAVLVLVVTSVVWAKAGSAATITERSVTLRIEGASVVEDSLLVVRLDERGDPDSWNEYSVYLDDDTVMLSCTAEVMGPDGVVVQSIPQRKHRRVESAGFGLYSSAWASVIPFPALQVGQTLRIRVVTRETPLFPATSVQLVRSSPQERVTVRVQGGSASLRWRFRPEAPQFTVSETSGGVTVEGRDVPAWDPPEEAPPSDLASPVLRVCWGEADQWPEVGVWYDRMTRLPPIQGEVAALARSLCPEGTDRRGCVEQLARHVKTMVRYEAVEIAEGSWVPTPPAEVLARRWGDCKDKAQLLRAMLDAVGVSSRLVLIRAGAGGEIDTGFPWPYSFNHCILAVPEAEAGARPDDPVAGGLLFVDPTSDMGGVAWLTPACQDRPALVVDGAASALIRSPESFESERRTLTLTGDLRSDGSFVGTAQLRLDGVRAVGWIRDVRSEPAERIAESVTRYLAGSLPGVHVQDLGWAPVESALPGFLIQGRVSVPGVVQGETGRRSMRPLGLGAIPEGRILDDRTLPVVLWRGIHRTLWKIELPEGWCPPVPSSSEVDNAVGRFSLQVGLDADGALVIDRHAEIRRGLVDPDRFDDLRELAVAENRGSKRRIRLRCPRESEAQ